MPTKNKKVNRSRKVIRRGKKMSTGGSRKVTNRTKKVAPRNKKVGISRKVSKSRKMRGGALKHKHKPARSTSKTQTRRILGEAAKFVLTGPLYVAHRIRKSQREKKKKALNYIKSEPAPANVTRATYAKIITGKQLDPSNQKVIDSIKRYEELLPKYKGLPESSQAKLEFHSKFAGYPRLVKAFKKKTI